MEKLYAYLQAQKLESGVAFVVVNSNHLIEATLYRRHIIGLKAHGLSVEEMGKEISANQVREVRVTPGEPDLTALSAPAILATFAAALPHLMHPSADPAHRTNDTVRVMATLAKLGESVAGGALELMSRELKGRFPSFSTTSQSMATRWKQFRDQYAVSAALAAEAAPLGSAECVVWAVSGVAGLEQSRVTDAFLHTVFFGSHEEPLFATQVKRDAGFGAKVGAVKLSKSAYQQKAGKSTQLKLYVGHTFAGELPIVWVGEEKGDALLTKADLDKMQLKDSQAVNILFTN
jgi:hypothetical protein